MKPYKLGRKGGRRWAKILLSLAVLVAVLGVVGYFGVRSIYERNLEPVSLSDTEQRAFTIASGDTPAIIADQLKDKDLIRSTRAFLQYVRSQQVGEGFIAGTYKLQKSMTVQEIVSVLTSGQVATDLFTILPGQRLESIRQSLITQGEFSAAEVDTALRPNNYAGHPALVDKPESASLEGFLYPDSYEKVASTRPETIIRQALDEMAEALTPDIRAAIAAQGLSVYEGITLASIVEKEAGVSSDKPAIAKVFLNRIEIGMRLQSDPTAVYGALRDGVELPEEYAISAAIDHPSDYNTYTIDGLMPGPISNVSISSLEAVANPGSGDFLFFVAGADCVTRFSKTVNEHEALVARHGLSTMSEQCH